MKTGQACKGTTKKGEPCKKDAYEDTGYCRQHQAQRPEVAEEAPQRPSAGLRSSVGATARALRLHVSQRGPRPRRERSQVSGTRPLALHHQKKTPRGIDHRAKMVQQEYRTWKSSNSR